MKLAGITLWRVPLTSHVTYYMSEGKSCGTIYTMVLRLTTQCGQEGWGEVCPIKHYLPAYAHGVAPALKRAGQGSFALDESRSAVDVEACHAFPDNLVFETLATYVGREPGRHVRQGAMGATMRRREHY